MVARSAYHRRRNHGRLSDCCLRTSARSTTALHDTQTGTGSRVLTYGNAQSRENCHDNTITVCYRLSRLTTWRRARVISFLCPATDGRPKRRAATTTTSRRNTGRSRRQLNRWRNLIGKRPRSSKLTRHPRSARGPGHNYSLFCRFSFCSSIRNLKIDAQKSDESEEKKKRLLEYLKTTDDLAFLFLHFFARTFKEYIS